VVVELTPPGVVRETLASYVEHIQSVVSTEPVRSQFDPQQKIADIKNETNPKETRALVMSSITQSKAEAKNAIMEILAGLEAPGTVQLAVEEAIDNAIAAISAYEAGQHIGTLVDLLSAWAEENEIEDPVKTKLWEAVGKLQTAVSEWNPGDAKNKLIDILTREKIRTDIRNALIAEVEKMLEDRPTVEHKDIDEIKAILESAQIRTELKAMIEAAVWSVVYAIQNHEPLSLIREIVWRIQQARPNITKDDILAKIGEIQAAVDLKQADIAQTKLMIQAWLSAKGFTDEQKQKIEDTVDLLIQAMKDYEVGTAREAVRDAVKDSRLYGMVDQLLNYLSGVDIRAQLIAARALAQEQLAETMAQVQQFKLDRCVDIDPTYMDPDFGQLAGDPNVFGYLEIGAARVQHSDYCVSPDKLYQSTCSAYDEQITCPGHPDGTACSSENPCCVSGKCLY
ncbi:MAG TPA: hypothetical protein VJA22_00205, partial [Patescibacteria group bacterium]|nr:hypothetical protein [Patescibacteria group bacterium]